MSATLTDLNLPQTVKFPRPKEKKTEIEKKKRKKSTKCNEKIKIEKITKAPNK